MSTLDLEAMRARACALRNTTPGHEEDGETPEIVYLYECEETGHTHTADVHHCPPPEGYSYAGCMLVVGAGCEMLTVPTNEGEQMPEVAEAICHAGADILAMADEIERLRGERYRLAEAAWEDAKDMFAPSSDAEFRLTQLAEELETAAEGHAANERRYLKAAIDTINGDRPEPHIREDSQSVAKLTEAREARQAKDRAASAARRANTKERTES